MVLLSLITEQSTVPCVPTIRLFLGDHFRVGDHFGVGIISGAVQYTSTGADVCSQTEMEVGTWVMVNCNELS